MSVLHDLLFFISAAVDALLMFVQSRAECFRKRPRESNAYLSPLPPFMGKTAPTLEFRDQALRLQNYGVMAAPKFSYAIVAIRMASNWAMK
jgi:hypothetical protein